MEVERYQLTASVPEELRVVVGRVHPSAFGVDPAQLQFVISGQTCLRTTPASLAQEPSSPLRVRILYKLHRTFRQLLQSFGLHERGHLVAAIDLCGNAQDEEQKDTFTTVSFMKT